MALLLVSSLGLFSSACGGKKSMEGAGDEEQVGKVEETTRLQGEEEGVAQASFDETERARRLAALPKGSTRSGEGKLRSYTTKGGDTLWKIAERKDVYGSGWLYPIIYKANKALIKDPAKLEAGLKLTIPRNVTGVEEEMAKEEAMTGQILDGTPVASASPTPVVAKAGKVKTASKGHGWLWFLLVLIAGAGFWVWRRKKAQSVEPETTA